MSGKTCVITGATDGIGYVAAWQLAQMGAHVVLVGRNAAKVDAAVRRIVAETGNTSVGGVLADLSSQAEVRRLATELRAILPRLDVLLNNAGAIFLSRRTSADGMEMTFALNHMGYFVLTQRLLTLLQQSAPARIINVSSSAHRSARGFDPEMLPNTDTNHGYAAYSRSKLCNVLYTYELARRLKGTGVTVNALHPGLVRTNIARNNGLLGRVVNLFIGARGIDASAGAESLVYLASSAEVQDVSGQYFVNSKSVASSALSYDEGVAARLWSLSERLAGGNEQESDTEAPPLDKNP